MVYDSIKPVLAISAVEAPVEAGVTYLVADQVQNVTGKATDANLASVTVNGVPVTLDHHSIFSYAVSGQKVITVVATDLAGNTKTITRNVAYDPGTVKITMSPVENYDSISDGSVVTMQGQTIAFSLDRAVSFAQVKKTDPLTGASHTYSAEKVNGSNDYVAPVELNFNTITQEGFNDIQIIAGYIEGTPPNTVTKKSVKKLALFVDPANPEVSVKLPKHDQATNASTYSLSAVDGTAVKLFATFDGGTREVQPDTPFGITLTKEGVNPVFMKSLDSTGAASDMVRNIIYDITPPLLGRPDLSGSLGTVTGDVEPGAIVTYSGDAASKIESLFYTDGGAKYSIKFKTATPATYADFYSIYLTATDSAGNTTAKFAVSADGDMNVYWQGCGIRPSGQDGCKPYRRPTCPRGCCSAGKQPGRRD
jgi:hypothetical protein